MACPDRLALLPRGTETENPPLSQDLSDLLAHTHRGYFIPPRPEKNVVEGQRMTKDFIEARRAALEKYLAKLVAHPVICQSPVSGHVHSAGMLCSQGDHNCMFICLSIRLLSSFQPPGLVFVPHFLFFNSSLFYRLIQSSLLRTKSTGAESFP